MAVPLPPVGAEAKRRLLDARRFARDEGRQAFDELDVIRAVLEDAEVRSLVLAFGLPPDALAGAGAQIAEARGWTGFWEARGTTPGLEETLVERARLEAYRFGHAEVAPAHLLLALDETRPYVLGRSGTRYTLDDARDALRHLRGELPDWTPPAPRDHPDGPAGGGPGDVDDEDDDLDLQGDLRRVVAVGQSVEASGVIVELLCLEIRTSVALLYWHVRSAEDRSLMDPDVVVSDAAGTPYRAHVMSAGGTAGAMRVQVLLVPPPSDDARLRVEVTAFGRSDWARYPDPDRTDPPPAITGPWVFGVDLGA